MQDISWYVSEHILELSPRLEDLAGDEVVNSEHIDLFLVNSLLRLVLVSNPEDNVDLRIFLVVPVLEVEV